MHGSNSGTPQGPRRDSGGPGSRKASARGSGRGSTSRSGQPSMQDPLSFRSSAASDRMRQREMDEDREIAEAFALFDADGSGSIDVTELRTRLVEMGFGADESVVGEPLQRVLEVLDTDGGGTITLSEFQTILKRKLSADDTEEEIMKSYYQFDREKKGNINLTDLKRVYAKLGEDQPESKLRDMIRSFATTPSGKKECYITTEEFKLMVKGNPDTPQLA